MSFYWGACATAFLLVGLTGCASAGSLFSEDIEPAQSIERDPPQQQGSSFNKSCNYIAEQRADDALLAGYVTANSPDQKAIYNATYRDCVDWQKSH